MKYNPINLVTVVFHHILEESDIDARRITIAKSDMKDRFECLALFHDGPSNEITHLKATIQIQNDFSFTDVAYIYVDVTDCPGDLCMKHYTYEGGDVVDQLTGEVIFH